MADGSVERPPLRTVSLQRPRRATPVLPGNLTVSTTGTLRFVVRPRSAATPRARSRRALCTRRTRRAALRCAYRIAFRVLAALYYRSATTRSARRAVVASRYPTRCCESV
ncbi:hypothetical protein EVAR_43295_1 [Eumeta japonica]|uniref:Uncharacterized protein n=1 Tax=Eumeta variegata TaxID=151549 RepID=A0A4C1WXS3_EUMVA|nr:hypothetical protein EVAR_43295_1 [Eumeta japonica]